MLKSFALLIFALLSQNAQINALGGLPLDTNSAVPPLDVESVLNQSPLGQLASQLIQTSCLLVSPTDAERIEMCVGILTEKLQLPSIASAKHVSPLALASMLDTNRVRDITELSSIKNVDSGLIANLLSELLTVLQNPLTSQHRLYTLQKETMMKVLQSGLAPEKIASILTENSLLTNRLPAVPGLSGLPGVPSVPGLPSVLGLNVLPGVPGLPSVPGLNGLPSVSGLNGLPSVPGLNGLPSVPGLNGLPGVPGLNGLPGVPGLNGLPSVPGLNGLPSVPGLNGLPSVPGLNGLPGVPGLNGLPSVPGLNGLPGVPGLNRLPSVPGLNGLPSVPGLNGNADLMRLLAITQSI